MRKFLSVLIGLVLLAAAAVTLWFARGPQPKTEVTTGGVLFSQAEVAAQTAASGGQPDLGTVVDTGVEGSPSVIPLRPEISEAALSDVTAMEPGELESMPETTATAGSAEGVPLTTDIVLSADSAVAVAPISAGGGAPAGGQGGAAGGAGGYEQRVVELEWPDNLAVGRGGSVRVKLKVLSSGALQPVAEIADNEVLATPILLTDRYDTHDALVTATISAPDFSVKSITNNVQSLQRGGEAEWRWTIESNSSQTSVISLGLSITWSPKPGQPPGPTNVPIWGQTVQVEVNYVFGFITVPQASIAGTVLGVVGVVAEIPLLEKFLEIFWNVFLGGNRRRRQREDRRNRRTRRR